MKIVLSSICLETGTDIQLALYYLKAYLLTKYPSADVTIRVFNEKQSSSAIVGEIAALAPDLVGFSCYLWNIGKTLRICRLLKQPFPRVKIVLGGPEVSSRAQELLEREGALDSIVRGEGEESFAELVSRLRRSPNADLSGLQGISFRSGASVIHNPPRSLLRSVGSIPSVYLSGLVDLKDKDIVDVPLETVRGCACRCHYCYYHKNFPAVRNFSLGRVERELARILAHKPHEVYLMDPTFNADPARAKRILRLFIKHNRGTNLHVELKAELVDEEMARLLSEANAYNIEIGIQSTNPRTLKAVNRGFDRRRFRKGIRLLNKFGLYYEVQLIDALPHQSYDDLKRSLDWLYSLRPAKVVIFRLNVLPGTTLRQEAERFGIEYERRAPYRAVRSDAMTGEDIRRLEKLSYAMDRLYDSQVFRKTLYAFKARAKVKISRILEDWVEWEGRFKSRPADYPAFLNRTSPLFLQYLCRKHAKASLYRKLLPGLLRGLCSPDA